MSSHDTGHAAVAPGFALMMRAAERAQVRAGRPVRTAEIFAELTPSDRAALTVDSLNGFARQLRAIVEQPDAHGRQLRRHSRCGHALWSVRFGAGPQLLKEPHAI